jgi:four helix bundle protein
MKGESIKDRMKAFALRIINMTAALPINTISPVLARMILESSISTGAYYRNACRSTSRRDFVSRLKLVEKEIEETGFLLELIEESKVFPQDRISPLAFEANQLLSIITKSIKTARENGNAKKERKKPTNTE